MAFLPRHGVGHFIPPSEINFRANNFFYEKNRGGTNISISAVGSMKDKLHPGHFSIPHQFIDRTTRRISTFFTTGMVGHVSLADPVCLATAEILSLAAQRLTRMFTMAGLMFVLKGRNFLPEPNLMFIVSGCRRNWYDKCDRG